MILLSAETIIFYYLFLLFPQNVMTMYLLFAGLVAATTVQRLYWAWSHLDAQQ